MTMSVVERTAGLDDIPELCREGQRRFGGDYFLEALAFQILHGDKRSAARFSQLVNGNDVGVLQASRSPGLAIKALQWIGALVDASRDRLDGDGAANERIASLEDDSHSSAADLLEDFVSANVLFFAQRHNRGLASGLVYRR